MVLRTLVVGVISSVLILGAETLSAQQKIELEVEPVAYILNGAGATAGYQSNNWQYSAEIYGLDLPESLHGNESFDASLIGAEAHLERFFNGTGSGFFIGPEFGVSRLEVTHQTTGISEEHIQYSIGVRGGYRWYTGLGKLYLSPVGGLGYTLNSKDFEIEGDVFESGNLTPFITVDIGWSFGI